MASAGHSDAIASRSAEHWLRRTRLLARAAAVDIAWLAARAERRWYAPGTRLVEPGQTADGLLVIVAGRVLVDEGPAGSGVQVALGPGDTLGELATLEGAPHSTAAVAHELTEALFVRREALLTLVRRSRTLALHLLATVAGWARRADQRAAELALRSTGAVPFSFRRLQPAPGEVRTMDEECE